MDGNSKMDAASQKQGGEQLTGAEIVLRALADQGVDTIFGYPGGAVLPIYDAIYAQQQVRHILVPVFSCSYQRPIHAQLDAVHVRPCLE